MDDEVVIDVKVVDPVTTPELYASVGKFEVVSSVLNSIVLKEEKQETIRCSLCKNSFPVEYFVSKYHLPKEGNKKKAYLRCIPCSNVGWLSGVYPELKFPVCSPSISVEEFIYHFGEREILTVHHTNKKEEHMIQGGNPEHLCYILNSNQNGLKSLGIPTSTLVGIRETVLAMSQKGIIRELRNIILRYSIWLLEGRRTNERRTLLKSRIPKWVREFDSFRRNDAETLNKSLLRKGIIGLPLYVFTLREGKLHLFTGVVNSKETIYFAVKQRDVGITARLTHSIPSVYRSVNHVGWYEKIIGYDPEPISFSKIPYLVTSDWTVFLVSSNVLRKDPRVLWFTVYSREGLISSCPFTCFKGSMQYPIISESDIAEAMSNKIVINHKEIPFEQLCTWVT